MGSNKLNLKCSSDQHRRLVGYIHPVARFLWRRSAGLWGYVKFGNRTLNTACKILDAFKIDHHENIGPPLLGKQPSSWTGLAAFLERLRVWGEFPLTTSQMLHHPFVTPGEQQSHFSHRQWPFCFKLHLCLELWRFFLSCLKMGVIEYAYDADVCKTVYLRGRFKTGVRRG